MRKLLFAAAFAASVTGAYAQKLEDVQEKIAKGKYDEAKEKLEKFLADPKNAKNSNAYYYKGVINTYFAQTDTAGTLTFDASKEAFDAYRKALELDPKQPLMTIDQNIGLFQLFDMHYNRGINKYNSKNYDAAFQTFKRAVDVQDFIKSKNFSLPNYTPPALDTQLVNLTASSAYLAKKHDEAIPYFEKIANARVKGPEYKEIYAIIVQHYLNKKDEANASKYLTVASELFPDEEYWLSIQFNTPEMQELNKQMDALRAKYDQAAAGDKAAIQKEIDIIQDKQKDARLARYEQMAQKYPNNATLAMDYAIDLFNHTYVWDKKPADYADRQARLNSVLQKALALNASNPIGHFVQSQHIYSQIFDIEDARRAITGNTPAAANKRKEMNTQLDKKYDELAAASQKAFDLYSALPELKPQDRVNYRKVTDQLIDYYTRKKMNDKVTFYQNKKAAIK